MIEEGKKGLTTARIEALCDGIFAICMTLLVLSFDTIFDKPPIMSERYLIGVLKGLWPDFLHYVESFIILGAFWYQHHRQFHFIKRSNIPLLFINIAAFMFIALIPFSTTLVGDFGHTKTASIFFELNLLIAGLIFFGHWMYATHKGLIPEDLDPKIVKYYEKRNLVIPVVSFCAIILSLINPRIGTILYFFVPVILLAWKRK